jgi:glutamine synthetase
MLRSEEAISRECTRLLNVIGETDVKFVRTTMGPEQEFFLIDRGYYLSRPDLVAVGRTVIGASPNKGQESEYHYFGAIDQRVLACLQELEIELWKLGIPVKTRHNEVAPSQFEMAPIYEGSVIAADHNLLAMDVLREVATKHGLACLLHEKPFNYVNGSGKHLNWSLETNKKENLLEPGATPRDNQRFILFLAVILRAVHIHGDMLRAVIAVPGNTYRLGANEAPPVIISAYLGSELDAACKSVMAADSAASNGNAQNVLRLGVSNLPPLPRDPADRNRTSPFAFTGNKFEFRACGSSQNISFPITVLNSIIAESVRYFADEIEKRISSGTARSQAINSLIIEELKKHYTVVFNGNGYSEEWITEAVKRGLPLLKTAPEALAVWDKPESQRIFKELGVLNAVEASSRSLILHEAFFETMLTEARVMVDLTTSRVTPAAITYQQQLAKSYNSALAVLKDEKLFTNQKGLLNTVTGLIESLIHNSNELREIVHKAESDAKKGDFRKALATWYGPIMNSMPKVRSASDELEQVLSDDLWPLAKYSEIFLTSK